MRLFLFLILFVSLTNLYSQNTPPRNDFQFWNDVQFIFPLIKSKDEKGKEFDKIALIFSTTLRIGRNWQHLVDERIGFGLDFKINKYLTLSPSFFYRGDQPFVGKKEKESRYRFAATLEKKYTKFSIKDRNLIEYRDRYLGVANSTRFRNKFTFTVPITKEKKELLTPFVSDEVFYDFGAKAWSRNEITIGLTKKFHTNFSSDFYYIYQRNRGNTLKNINALGINLKIRID